MSAQLERAAREIVDDLVRVFDEPPLPTHAVSLAQFRHVDQRFYESRTRELLALGFQLTRDVDASALLNPRAPPTPLRVLIHPAHGVGAALFHSIPKSPGFIQKLLLRLTGGWHEPRVLNLVSFVGDDVMEILDSRASFFASPPWLHRSVREPGTAASELLDEHLQRVARLEQERGVSRRRFDSFDAFMIAREATRVRQNQWRREVGGLLPDELDRMLAPHGATGERVRPFLERELDRRRLRGCPAS